MLPDDLREILLQRQVLARLILTADGAHTVCEIRRSRSNERIENRVASERK